MSKKKDILKPQLWTTRSVADTMSVYADWADEYEAEVTARGYHTPERLAKALTEFIDPETLILDYGCGTGISGAAMARAGRTNLHGTDITAEMLAQAENRGIYDKTWLSPPGELDFGRGAYSTIIAVGVVSLGAAPADMLAPLVAKLDTGGLLAFSYNDPTLADQSYTDALGSEIASGRAEVIFREHGPHLDDVGMGSDVIILRRR